MLELIPPTPVLHGAWREARQEWGPGMHEDGVGLQPSDDVDSPAGFAAWIDRLASEPRSTCRWIVESGRVLGGIALRHEVSDLGQVGYGIRPSERGRGVATWALGQMLIEARRLGLDRLLVVCEADNAAP